MKGRIKELRKHVGLTQAEFGERLGIKQNTVAQYEIGRNMPTDTVVELLCREFGVNETWLRTGEGEMFIPVSRDAQIAAFVGNAMKGEENNFQRRLLAVLARLSAEEWELIERKARELLEE